MTTRLVSGPALLSALAVLLSMFGVPASAVDLQFEVVAGSYEAFKPNAVIVYSDAEAILFDALLTSSDGEKLAQRIEQIGRPLKSIYLTHAHPDHVFGVGTVLARYPDVPIYARPAIKAEIERDFLAERRRVQTMYPGDIPAQLPAITPLNDRIQFAGVEIPWIDTSRAETFAATVYYLSGLRTVIPGDLIFNKFHLYLADMNDPVHWIKAVERIRAAFPDATTVIPGHGPAAGPELYDLNIEYLHTYIDAAADPFANLQVIGERLLAKYPDWDWPMIVHMTRGPAVTDPELLNHYTTRGVARALLPAVEQHRLVDLTQAFHPGIPHRVELGDQIIEPLYAHTPGVGKLGTGGSLDRHTLVGQWGTHVDPPVHFVAGMRTLDQIGLEEMILPLVVIDIHDKAAVDPDYVVTMADVRGWEADYGPIPARSFVALRSDWSKRWADEAKFFNRDADGIGHYPGWSREVLVYLDEQRNITAIGHETADTDPGIVAWREGFPLELYHLSHDKYQIEMLANLDQVPPQGAVVIATWPKLAAGSGFPARVIAILPSRP